MNDAPNTATMTAQTTKEMSAGFIDEEGAPMKERARELKVDSGGRGKNDKADAASDQRAMIAEVLAPDRATAQRLHANVMTTALMLSPMTWYGAVSRNPSPPIVARFAGKPQA